MQTTTRRALLVAAATLSGGTVAAATLWRKPAPELFTLVDAEVRPASVAGLVPASPSAPPAPAVFLNGDGDERRIADFAGQGLVLNLWATWCVPCVVELPQLEAAARALKADRIQVLPLSSDRGGAPVVRRFFAAHDIQGLGVWLDPKGSAARAWGARGLPTTLIIDRQGREVARLEGPYGWANPAVLAELRRLVG